MRRVVFDIGFVAVAILIFDACQKPLDIKAVTTNANILVVEGLINTGTDSTIIKLSRTVVIASKNTANPETGATVTIENAQATVGTLKETVKGTYASPSLNLDNTKQYRVRIKTGNGKTYVSDLVTPKVTPPIDSIGYTVNDSGIQLYANSHDPTNNGRYYIYNFNETWQFHALYYSGYISNGTTLIQRQPPQYIYYCFASDASVNVLINSTAALSQDVTYSFPLTTVSATSEKLEIKYSILVTQTALTKEAYAFWDNLKKNTEQLGSIFDAQPSQLTGNIHNAADASEPVIGYISAANTQSKRIFIDRAALPQTQTFTAQYPYSCTLDTALYSNRVGFNEVAAYLIQPNRGYYTISPDVILGNLIGYSYSTPLCSDCTLRGHIQQPSFWK